MGIPSYFSNIIKNYPQIIKKIQEYNLSFDHFFLDANSIIYDCARQCHAPDDTTTLDDLHDLIIHKFIQKIEEYIAIVRPKSTVMISIDGTPPVAKLEQQRQRRYKSYATSSFLNSVAQCQDETEKETPDKVRFNTIEITTGTSFMRKINRALDSHFADPSTYNVDNILISHADIYGEGESKIFEFIRQSDTVKKNDTCLIYGLDADLIMLGLNNLTHCKNIYLFRETPEFIKSIDSSLEPNANYALDIPLLSKSITFYMNNGKVSTVDRTQDYIFLCFLLGNDFLPHFPAVNIRTDGIDKIMNAYSRHFANTKNMLIVNNTISWKQFRKIITDLASNENAYIVKEIQKRNRYKNREYPLKTQDDVERRFNELPTQYRTQELLIHPMKEPCWRDNYYSLLFNIDNIDEKRREQISTNYLEGLEWTFKYYTNECPDWRWYYKYHYPPLLSDLIAHIPYFDTTFIQNKRASPVSQAEQLCYVLPKNQLSLLPQQFVDKLTDEHCDWYTENAPFQWAFCKYFWESHAELPNIQLDELAYFVSKHKSLLKVS